MTWICTIYDLEWYCFDHLTIMTVEMLNNYCTVYKEMQTILASKIPRRTFFWGIFKSTPAEKDFVAP